MQVFRGCVEITAENAVLGLRAGHLNGLSNARTRLTDAARGEFAKAGGRRMRRICKGQRQQLQRFGEKFKESKPVPAEKKGRGMVRLRSPQVLRP